RSVSGLINPSPQTSQHTYRQKTDIFGKSLKYMGIISIYAKTHRMRQIPRAFCCAPAICAF
ncbi:hypothetical protein, partial [Agrobacterium pusense]